VTGSEFVFLALGLILGVAAGAALIESIRARPRAREVRLTVAPDAVPRRRAATLANDAFTDSAALMEPAHGGPADRRGLSTDGTSSSDGRTPVLGSSPGTVAEPVFRLTEPAAASSGPLLPGAPRRAVVAAQALPISSGIDPMLSALRASAAASAEAAMQAIAAPLAVAVKAEPRVDAAVTPTAKRTVPAESPPTGSAGPSTSRGRGKTSRQMTAPSPPPAAPTAPSARGEAPGGPCGDARRLADERCELASRARAQATEAEEAHRAAQRAYDDHEQTMAAASAAADARGVREAKDQAQARFRAARAGARSADDIETAAREWLHEINRINAETGDASAAVQRARAASPAMAVRLERTGLEAEGARVAAEQAEAACVAARQTLADCEEQATAGTPSSAPTARDYDHDRGRDRGIEGDGSGSDSLVAALRAGASPRIVRLLRGDRSAMQEVVDALAAGDPNERRRWQLAMADFVDAILADAITASALEFPTDHAFWGPFDRAQGREITAALSSLGYRFDGLGGWVDDRQPSQRDLSLALGYAGLDPMRMRHWPSEAEMATLYEEVEVAAAEHLASRAGGLTLGELVTMLGRRADALAEIWNAWGRIRPVLLDER
jgi:hypothetical protein